MSASFRTSIAFVQTQAENAGAQEISRLLARDLELRGYEIHQIFLFRRTDSFDHAENALFCAASRPSNPLAFLRCLIRLYRMLRRLRPQILVSFQHYGNLISAPVARLAGVPHIVANQVSAAYSVQPAVRIADRIAGCLGVYDRIVVNSSATEAVYGAYPRPYRRRVVRIDHGFEDKSLPLSKASAREALGLPLAGVTLGCAARLHPMKQIEAAIALLPFEADWRLVLAGQGSDRARLESFARAQGVEDRVRFLGELPPERMGVFLASLDCFVFPSAAETFGLAPVEAAQAGVPVVCNRVPVLQEVLATTDGEPCALFVDAHDAPAFAAAVKSVLRDAELAARLRAAGVRLAMRYPRDAMADSYAALLRSFTQEPACASGS